MELTPKALTDIRCMVEDMEGLSDLQKWTLVKALNDMREVLYSYNDVRKNYTDAMQRIADMNAQRISEQNIRIADEEAKANEQARATILSREEAFFRLYGAKIKAIECIRARLGLGLADAKRAIELAEVPKYVVDYYHRWADETRDRSFPTPRLALQHYLHYLEELGLQATELCTPGR